MGEGRVRGWNRASLHFDEVIHLALGLLWLGTMICFVLRMSWSGMVLCAVLALGYLPFGTLLSPVQIVLLFLPAVRPGKI